MSFSPKLKGYKMQDKSEKKTIEGLFYPFLNSTYPEAFRKARITEMNINKQTRKLSLSADCSAFFENKEDAISSFIRMVKGGLSLNDVEVKLNMPDKTPTAAERQLPDDEGAAVQANVTQAGEAKSAAEEIPLPTDEDVPETDEIQEPSAQSSEELFRKLKELQEQADAELRAEKSKKAEEAELDPEKPHRIKKGIPLYLETARIIYGKIIGKKPKPISEVRFDDGQVVIWGDMFGLEIRETRDKRNKIINFAVTDHTNSYPVKIFNRAGEVESLCACLEKGAKSGLTLIIRGDVIYDNYKKEYIIDAKAIARIRKIPREDEADEKRVELHMHSNMSMMDAIADAGKLVSRAAEWGHRAVAITDHGVLQGYPAAFAAASKTGIKVIYGVESYTYDDLREGAPKTWEDILQSLKDKKTKTYHQIILVLNNTGLKNLYQLVSKAHTENFYKKPITLKSELAKHREGLLIGSACEAGELYRAIENNEGDERIQELVDFYDYMEIQPDGNNAFKLRPRHEYTAVFRILRLEEMYVACCDAQLPRSVCKLNYPSVYLMEFIL